MTVSKTTTQEKARHEGTITMPLDKHISDRKNTAELQKENARLKGVCDEIQEIVLIYGEQAAEGCVDSPGGLEHMGDVWRLLCKWDAVLSKEKE